MRLTNFMRDAFIKAAMDDVPAAADLTEAAHKIVVDDVVAQLPPLIKRAWADNALRPYVKTRHVYMNGFTTVFVPTGESTYSVNASECLTHDAQVKLAALTAEQIAAKKVVADLQNKLRSVAYACTTRKALAEALPEFEKYLPKDDAAACRTLPAVANVVADFVKAGWPKGKKVAA